MNSTWFVNVSLVFVEMDATILREKRMREYPAWAVEW
jgi:hypothetical protein